MNVNTSPGERTPSSVENAIVPAADNTTVEDERIVACAAAETL